MDYINLIIEEVIKEKVDKKSQIIESFSKIKNVKKDNIEEEIILTTMKLIIEGYDLDEIETSLNGIDPNDEEDWFNKYIKGNTKETIWSMAKEYLIKFLLEFLGIKNQEVSTGLAQFFADRSPTVLIKPFKNKEYCTQYLPDISDGVLEVITRHLMSKASGSDKHDYSWKSIGQKGVGNLLGEAIATSNISEILTNKICNYIHD